MGGRLEIVSAVVTFVYLGFILGLVRRRQLREKYALLWLGVGAVAVLLTVARSVLDHVAGWLGFAYGPSALFLFSNMFLMAVAAHLSWEVSRLEDKTRRLAEEVTLMRPQPPISHEIDISGADSEAEKRTQLAAGERPGSSTGNP